MSLENLKPATNTQEIITFLADHLKPHGLTKDGNLCNDLTELPVLHLSDDFIITDVNIDKLSPREVFALHMLYDYENSTLKLKVQRQPFTTWTLLDFGEFINVNDLQIKMENIRYNIEYSFYKETGIPLSTVNNKTLFNNIAYVILTGYTFRIVEDITPVGYMQYIYAIEVNGKEYNISMVPTSGSVYQEHPYEAFNEPSNNKFTLLGYKEYLMVTRSLNKDNDINIFTILNFKDELEEAFIDNLNMSLYPLFEAISLKWNRGGILQYIVAETLGEKAVDILIKLHDYNKNIMENVKQAITNFLTITGFKLVEEPNMTQVIDALMYSNDFHGNLNVKLLLVYLQENNQIVPLGKNDKRIISSF